MAHAGSSGFTVPRPVPRGPEPEPIVVRQRSRSLTVRSPKAFVRRIIDACDLTDLLGPEAGNLGGRRSAPGWQCRQPSGPIGSPVRPLRCPTASPQAQPGPPP